MEARNTAQSLAGTIKSHFCVQALSEYEKTIIGYLRLVVIKSLPLSYVDDAEIRSYSKFNISVSSQTIILVTIKLVELFEDRIKEELEGTKRFILIDGWTCNSIYFIGMFSSYCNVKTNQSIPGITKDIVVRLKLLSIFPMNQDSGHDNSDVVNEEETYFNGEVHIKFFCESFLFFRQTFEKWCICLVADNTNTNSRSDKLLPKPHLGRNSNKLALEVNFMLKNQLDMKRVIESVHGTM